MDIFTPIEINEQEKLGANALVTFNKGAMENQIINLKQSYNLFWNNPQATPQQICDLLGNNAYKLFENYSVMAQAIMTIKPDAEVLMPADGAFTINQDGTVTIN